MDAAFALSTPIPIAGCPAGLEATDDDEVNFADGLDAAAWPDPLVDGLASLEERGHHAARQRQPVGMKPTRCFQ